MAAPGSMLGSVSTPIWIYPLLDLLPLRDYVDLIDMSIVICFND